MKMSEKKDGTYHENMKEEVIRRACEGDSSALGEVVAHYQNYVIAVIITTAIRFGLDPDEVPVEDLAQIVWVKFITKRISQFKKLD